MLMVLIFRDADIDGISDRYYRRYIDIWADISTHRDSIIDIMKMFDDLWH
jgi:hypothetical protein